MIHYLGIEELPEDAKQLMLEFNAVSRTQSRAREALLDSLYFHGLIPRGSSVIRIIDRVFGVTLKARCLQRGVKNGVKNAISRGLDMDG